MAKRAKKRQAAAQTAAPGDAPAASAGSASGPAPPDGGTAPPADTPPAQYIAVESILWAGTRYHTGQVVPIPTASATPLLCRGILRRSTDPPASLLSGPTPAMQEKALRLKAPNEAARQAKPAGSHAGPV